MYDFKNMSLSSWLLLSRKPFIHLVSFFYENP